MVQAADSEPPGRVQGRPFVTWCEPGKYAYCCCRRSRRFPYCDGTHRQLSGQAPIKVMIERAATVAWCACGESRNKPYCDGSHDSAPPA